MKTWRVTLVSKYYYAVDVEAESAKEAEKIAQRNLDSNDEYLSSLEIYACQDDVVKGATMEMEDLVNVDG